MSASVVSASSSGSSASVSKGGSGSGSNKNSKNKNKDKDAKAKEDAIKNSMELFFEQKVQERRAAKIAKSVLNNSWYDKAKLNDGKEMYGKLTDQYHKVNRILEPVINKKRFVEELDKIRSMLLEREPNREKNDSWFCWRILHHIHPPDGTLRQKRMLILWKFSVIRELKTRFNIESPTFRDARVLELMDRQHLKLSIIDPSLMRNFSAQRVKYWTEQKQLKKVKDAQSSCDKIFVCKSMMHYDKSGCPTCGVVFIGTSKTLAPYVKKVDRWTGVQTLVPLPFEIETLKLELEEQTKVVQKLYDELHVMEVPLRDLVCRNIQAWYVFKSAKWIKIKQEARRAKSIKIFRHRLLKLVKKYVDEMCDKNPDILGVDLYKYPDPASGLAIKFSFVRAELEEYVAERARRRHESTTKLAKFMIEKLKFKVNRARHKKFLEIQKANEEHRLFMERTKSARDAKALHLLRKKIQILESRTFICRRPSCDGRHFLSKDRFDVHCKIHKFNDDIRAAYLKKVKKIFDDRVKVEKAMLERIADSSFDIALADKFSMESEELLAIQEAEKKFNAPSVWTGFEVGHAEYPMFDPDPLSLKLAVLTKPNPAPLVTNYLLHEKFAKTLPMSVISYSDAHDGLAHNLMHRRMLHLELVSKHSNVEAPFSFPLKDPIVRVGTMLGCELMVTLSGKAKSEARLSKIHCIIQCFDNTVLDNSSKFGTYVVNQVGCLKVSSVVSHPLELCIGNLLCFGVKEDGPSIISATEAGESALVYRICAYNT